MVIPANAIKVKNIYILEGQYINREQDPYHTGLILELEDGRVLKHYSTDVVQPFGS